MKIVSRPIPSIAQVAVEFWIGENAADNEAILDRARPDDLWFHVDGGPSCHVIAVLPDALMTTLKNRKAIHKVAVQGAVLCKQHSKYRTHARVQVMYAPVKCVTKTETVGSVHVHPYKVVAI